MQGRQLIVSHEHRFIFLKTTKTAGTSVEIALSKFCGEDDVITHISPADEKIRRNLGYRGPQNCGLAPVGSYRAKDLGRLIFQQRLKPKFYNHMPAREAIPLVGRQVWDSYFKFCIERNPWDRFISSYFWRNKKEPRPAIGDFLDSGVLQSLKKWGIGMYTVNGKVVVDHVCRYEHLQSELDAIAEKLGFPEPLDLPRAKAGFRRDRRDPGEFLTEEAKERIRETFSDEISMYGYEI